MFFRQDSLKSEGRCHADHRIKTRPVCVRTCGEGVCGVACGLWAVSPVRQCAVPGLPAVAAVWRVRGDHMCMLVIVIDLY